MTVVFRADGSPRIGMGHLSRCAAVAAALAARGARAVLATRPELAASVPDAPWEVEPLAGGVAGILLGRRARWLVVDSYDVGAGELRALRATGAGVALLDDEVTPRTVEADLVINPNLGVAPEEVVARPGGTALVGPRYVPLHPAFAAHGRVEVRAAPLGRVLVVLGGADTMGLGGRMARELAGILPASARVVVVRGPLAPPSGADEEIGPLRPRELAAEMARADLAVATPSTVFFELATLGVPAALVQTAANQGRTAAALRARGFPVVAAGQSLAFAFAGPGGLDSPAVRRQLAREAAALVDGRGAERIADHLMAWA